MTSTNASRLLLVDDDPDLCYLLEKAFGAVGVQVYTVHNLKGAISFLRQHAVDVVLLDNHLPDGKGVDMIERMLKMQRAAKIILATADTDASLAMTAFENGAYQFIQKPFDRKHVADIALTMKESKLSVNAD